MNCGVYIHIPFCRTKCDYCSFYSIPVKSAETKEFIEIKKRYLSRLLDEISIRSKEIDGYSVDTIYFGGGTPSVLQGDDILNVIDSLKKYVSIADGCQVTIEVNPEDAREEKLLQFKHGGINRAVLGVQTLNPKIHNNLGRGSELCREEHLDCFFNAKGIEHCVDLIAGVPYQTGDDLLKDIDILTMYNPLHISAYILSIEKKTPLWNRVKMNPELEKKQRELFEILINSLKGKGYVQYEISNFSRVGYESKHNLKYWRYEPYIGFGPGSHSFINGKRESIIPDVKRYIETGRLEVELDERDGAADIVEFVLTGLRLLDGISLNVMEEKIAQKIPDQLLSKAYKEEKKGMVIIEKDRGDIIIRLSNNGIYFADSIIYNLVEDFL